MQTRLTTLLLLSSCYFPSSESHGAEYVELAPHDVLREGRLTDEPLCSERACYDFRLERRLNERNVGISTGKPDMPSLEVTLPVSVLDCSMVGLTVVGPWATTLGKSIVLNVLVRGLEGIDEPPTLSWETSAGELTELGPLSAEIQCNVPGTNSVSVEFAAPAPCPSRLEQSIDCQAPAN